MSGVKREPSPGLASTITQQLAKNMLLTNEISIKRKIKEILLASRIEAALLKDRIDPKGNWEARLAKLRTPGCRH
jgi:membrane carboxypeptidase/penicillin-binding protein